MTGNFEAIARIGFLALGANGNEQFVDISPGLADEAQRNKILGMRARAIQPETEAVAAREDGSKLFQQTTHVEILPNDLSHQT